MDLAAYWTRQLSRIFQTNWRWLVEIRKYEEIFLGTVINATVANVSRLRQNFHPLLVI